MKRYEAGDIEEVGGHRLGIGARGMDAGARAEGGGGGIVRAVLDDRGGGGVVQEGAGSGGFVQEVVRLVLAMGLSKEGATIDGGESGCTGAGGVEKGGYWQPYTICNQKPSEWRGVLAAASPTGWPPP